MENSVDRIVRRGRARLDRDSGIIVLDTPGGDKEERAMATQNIERRVEKLEEHLSKSDKPETIEEMFRSMERGTYGPVNVASITASILSNGGSGEPLRGKGLPDELIDHFVEAIKKGNAEERVNEN